MTTAYNFPDLDISPIEDLSRNVTINMSISSNTNKENVPVDYWDELLTSQECKSTTHISETREDQPESSFLSEISLESVAYEKQKTVEIFNYSSEEVFRQLENEVRQTLYNSYSQNAIEHSSNSCMSTSLLAGVIAYVDFQCCVESAQTVKSKLRQMGAFVVKKISPSVTHVIFARGGRKSTLQAVLAMEKRPYLVDPHWVHSTYFNQYRVTEDNFSLYGGKYFVDTIRRLSEPHEQFSTSNCNNNIEISLENDINPHQQEVGNSSIILPDRSDLTFDRPMTATQLLKKIQLLSKRLDRLAGTDDIEALTHGNRCMSRQQAHVSETTRTTGTSTNENILKNTIPQRRRSHGAFGLEFRAPFSEAVQHMKAIREAKNAEIGIRGGISTNVIGNTKILPKTVDAVDDMRKTSHRSLKQIRQTLRNNSAYRKKAGKEANIKSSVVPVINESRNEVIGSSIRATKHTEKRPIVSTASTIINLLQTVPSSDEFETREFSIVKKRGIVFTGFNRQEEKILIELAGILNLKVHANINKETRCVISYEGHRTLTTLKAVILGVPIVKATWLSECETQNKLVSLKNFVYSQWQKVLGTGKSLFARLGPILVIDGCSPPTEDLKWMIKACGGTVVSCANDSQLIVSPQDQTVSIPWTRTNRDPPLVVPENYIIDCITENTVLNISDYADVSISIIDHSFTKK